LKLGLIFQFVKKIVRCCCY